MYLGEHKCHKWYKYENIFLIKLLLVSTIHNTYCNKFCSPNALIESYTNLPIYI